jgi:DNA mismatch repair protein MutS
MDTLQSINHLYREMGYSIVRYLPANKSFTMKIKKLWHPFFDREKVVANTLKMKKERIRLITGPNAAGKSTFIKAVMLNILFAHTIGITSCSKISISPIHSLYTYLHIPDIKGKQSLFQAEMMRNKELLDHLAKENSDENQEKKNTFIIMDELFSSTNYYEGVSAAYSILKKISEYSNCKTITTTHFHELMKLEKETKKRIRNYYFDIHEIYMNENSLNDSNMKNKKIQYTYKMKKGENKKRIAIDLLKEENFDSDIIKNAREIFNREFGEK